MMVRRLILRGSDLFNDVLASAYVI